MTLTKQFDLAVLTHSDTAVRYNFDNTPTPEAVNNLKILYHNLLLPLVKQLPGELRVNCAYRSPKVNARVGGKPDSQHGKGMAADLEYWENGVEHNQVIIDTVMSLGLDYDQMIAERVINGKPSWVHLSYNINNNRKMFLKL